MTFRLFKPADSLESLEFRDVATYFFVLLSFTIPGWGYLHLTGSSHLSFTTGLELTRAIIFSVYYTTPIFIFILLAVVLDRTFLRESKSSDENSNVRYILFWSAITTLFSFIISAALFSWNTFRWELVTWMYALPLIVFLVHLVQSFLPK